MKNPIKNIPASHTLFAHLPADTPENRARLQLAYIASLFLVCGTIGYLRMGELFVSTHSVPLIGALLGM